MRQVAISEYRFRLALMVGGAGTGLFVFAALASPPGADLVRHVILFTTSFVLYLGAVVALLSTPESAGGGGSRRLLAAALLWALFLRVALLTTTPSLSDDVFRYVWDGKVVNAGIDPYRYSPAAPELISLRDSLWEGINHKEMPTPYPPVAEGLFALVYRLAPGSLTAMQAMAVAFDLGVVVLLWMLLVRLRLNGYRVLIYAWNPLVLLQFAHSGHFDSAMLVPLLGAICFLAAGRRAASGILLGLATLVKLIPAMVAPLFLPLWGVAGVVAAGITVVLGTAPLVGSPALAGVLSEASDARFNDSAGLVLTKLLGVVAANPDAAARVASSLALVGAATATAVVLWRRKAGWEGLLGGVLFLLGAFVLLNAVVEPWYLTWIVPFLCFSLPTKREVADGMSGGVGEGVSEGAGEGASGRAGVDGAARGGGKRRGAGVDWLAPSWGWLLLSGSIVLTDLTYAPGFAGSDWIWIRVAEYGPLYGLLAVWVWRRWERVRRGW